jgi:hypothetical protein
VTSAICFLPGRWSSPTLSMGVAAETTACYVADLAASAGLGHKSAMRACALAVILVLAGPAAAEPPDAPTAALLAEMREACGGGAWDRVEGWHETGRVELPGGMSLPYEAWHSMRHPPTATYVNRIEGRIVRQSGYDGAVRWPAGADGRGMRETDPAALRRARRDAWLSNFG